MDKVKAFVLGTISRLGEMLAAAEDVAMELAITGEELAAAHGIDDGRPVVDGEVISTTTTGRDGEPTQPAHPVPPVDQGPPKTRKRAPVSVVTCPETGCGTIMLDGVCPRCDWPNTVTGPQGLTCPNKGCGTLLIQPEGTKTGKSACPRCNPEMVKR